MTVSVMVVRGVVRKRSCSVSTIVRKTVTVLEGISLDYAEWMQVHTHSIGVKSSVMVRFGYLMPMP